MWKSEIQRETKFWESEDYLIGIGIHFTQTIRWFEDLPDVQKREFASIDIGVMETIGITKDWIEDHGGDRNWWARIITVRNLIPKTSRSS